MAGREPNRTVKSVERACEILDVLRESDGATVSELSDRVGLAPGTVHTHLSTLKYQGFVSQDGDVYDLGYRLLTLGEHVRNHAELYRAGKAQADQLAGEIDESTHLVIESEGREVVLESFGKKAGGADFYIRNREEPQRYLHCSAAGKAILAHLPEERVFEIVGRTGLVQVTPNTITDREEFLAELEAVREAGYATNDEEQVMGLRAVAAPIKREKLEICGAISISAPSSRLDAELFTQTYPDKVKSAANIIEVNLHTADDRV